MRAYSEDLRKKKKIVVALERGTTKAQAARLFDVSLSSLKRYSRIARQEGGTLTPKKGPGHPSKVDTNAEKLLQEDVKERRPAATVEQRRRFLERITGKTLSVSTLRRMLKRLGLSRKKGLWGRWNGNWSS